MIFKEINVRKSIRTELKGVVLFDTRSFVTFNQDSIKYSKLPKEPTKNTPKIRTQVYRSSGALGQYYFRELFGDKKLFCFQLPATSITGECFEQQTSRQLFLGITFQEVFTKLI